MKYDPMMRGPKGFRTCSKLNLLVWCCSNLSIVRLSSAKLIPDGIVAVDGHREHRRWRDSGHDLGYLALHIQRQPPQR